MFPLEPCGECHRNPLGVGRAKNTDAQQRVGRVKSVRTGPSSVAIRGAKQPTQSRMIGAQLVTDIKPRHVKGNQIYVLAPLDTIESACAGRLHHRHVNAGSCGHIVPSPRRHRARVRAGQLEPQ